MGKESVRLLTRVLFKGKTLPASGGGVRTAEAALAEMWRNPSVSKK